MIKRSDKSKRTKKDATPSDAVVVESNLPVVDDTSNKQLPSDKLLPVEADRVNNISQKEIALHAAGVTRRKVYERIGELLDAKRKVVIGTDKYGADIISDEPDLGRRKEGAELAMRAFGDSKEFLAVNTQVNNVLDVKAIVEAIARGGK